MHQVPEVIRRHCILELLHHFSDGLDLLLHAIDFEFKCPFSLLDLGEHPFRFMPFSDLAFSLLVLILYLKHKLTLLFEQHLNLVLQFLLISYCFFIPFVNVLQLFIFLNQCELDLVVVLANCLVPMLVLSLLHLQPV